MNIIHCSGCDGVGKSTLVKALSEATGYPVKHFDKPKDMEDGKRQYFEFLEWAAKQPKDSGIICDRLHDGEWVYAPLYRGYTADYMREFERELVKHNNYLFVYVKADLETIIDRTRKRGEDFVKEEHFQTVLNLFEKYVSEQALPFIEIDTTNSKTEDDVKTVLEAFEKVGKIWGSIRNGKCDGAVMTPALPRGNVNPKFVIVGQNPGGRGKESVKYSTTWCDIGLSTFMMNVVKEAGIFKDSWFTNLVPYPTPDNKINNQQIKETSEIIRLQIELLNPDVIVTLGNLATNEMYKEFGSSYEIYNVAHPAYVKRFYSGNKYKLQEYIQNFAALKG